MRKALWGVLLLTILSPSLSLAGQLGQGGGSSYPAALDTKTVYTNKATCDPTGTTNICASTFNDPDDAIVKIQTELGLLPKGTSASVAERIAGIRSLGGATADLLVVGVGGIGIGTAAPNAAALLDLTSTTKGLLPPRMTITQRDAIATPPDGLLIYNSTTSSLEHRKAGVWSPVGAVNSVSAADATLTITPTTGAVVAGINLANPNTWTATQTLRPPGTTGPLLLLDSTGSTSPSGGGEIRFADSNSLFVVQLIKDSIAQFLIKTTMGDILISPGGAESVRFRSTGRVGIKTATPNATMQIAGGLSVNVVTKTTAYTATVDDFVILADATAGAFTVTLPAASTTGIRIIVVKIDSSINAVTVSRAGTDTIEGAVTKTLSAQYNKIEAIANGGSLWFDLNTGLI